TMEYSLDDTIAGIATAMGEAGIGIVRISGPDARSILQRLFRPASQLEAREPESHRLRYGWIADPGTGATVDEVMAVWMRAPRSYTRQDVVEIHSHGGATPLRAVLALVLAAGARLAEPGEMTLRAFLNGRLDLAQAEAVLDVVRARTEAGLQVAQAQLGGALSDEIRDARARLLEVLAHLSALIDFPEDEVPPQTITPQLDEAARLLEDLLRTADRGMLLREGLRVAIVGRPNVGKSSLLNRLLRHERAIVTDIPGTTRDMLEESLSIRGIPVVLADTAGIRETADVVEALGVARSRAALEQADLVLLVLDASAPLADEDRDLAASVSGRPAIVVWNKLDLLDGGEPGENARGVLPNAPQIVVSARTGAGIEALEEQVWDLVLGGQALAATGREALVSNPRHKAALRRALDHIQAARTGLEEGLPADFLTIDLTAAVNALGEITGETATEDLLDVIFSRFCIGK
ncbi:MAG TPA: tRNA uridine-5-carboxymethylaminomethyl(34) synthesis GTPase MnmE, partial [Ardenticatenaceae bacterium]|nr:tRNA uridine-5-carboxymethylaminomethyl(34) synthesis GTPase MnmE [Ardenticatenaceae bacterium]